MSAAVREAIRHLDGRWARLWLRGGNRPVSGVVRVRVDGAGFLVDRPGRKPVAVEFATVVLWTALELSAAADAYQDGEPEAPVAGR
jgi:hypothetical protein